MRYVIAVDSGGTFTDCVVIDQEGKVTTAKAPSTPKDYSEGVVASVGVAAEKLGLGLQDLLESSLLFAHGTTVATNALLTRSGARAGLIATQGHEDVLLIGRTFQKVAGLSEDEIMNIAYLNKPVPLVPRQRTVGVEERVDWRGEVLVPLEAAEAARAIEELARRGVESIAVSLLWSFANPRHEQAIRDYCKAHHPEIDVTISSDLTPVLKEYERTATTVMNAYLGRRTETYLDHLSERLSESGLLTRPVVMQSSGGVIGIDAAKDRSVTLLTSGPAGGLVGARVLGGLLGHRNVITTDVGGTSFDVGLIVDGEPLYSESPIFEQYQLLLPTIDIATIGTGGGSIARVEDGVQRVGPQSAGSDPGPASYGRGGTQATVTDANVVLGRIDPEAFLDGRLRLNRRAAEEAIRRHVADPLGIGLVEAAAGIVAIADAHMADLIRRETVERGYDPKDFVLYAFGGAGPLHAGAYSIDVGCRTWVAPLMAPVFSAFGIAGSDLTVMEEASEPMYAPFSPDALQRIFRELEERAGAVLRANGARVESIAFDRYVTLRYTGQIHEIQTPLPAGEIDDTGTRELLRRFESIYERRYGRGTAYRQAGVQALTFRVRGRAPLYPPKLHKGAPTDSAARPYGQRRVYFEGLGMSPVDAYRAGDLDVGQKVAGPAVIDAPETVIVIPPAQTAQIDPWRNIVVSLSEAS